MRGAEPRGDGGAVGQRRAEADDLDGRARLAGDEAEAGEELLVDGAAARVADHVQLVDGDAPQVAERRRRRGPPPLRGPRLRGVERGQGLAVREAQRGLGRAEHQRARRAERRGAGRGAGVAAVDDGAPQLARRRRVVVPERRRERRGLLGDHREEREHVDGDAAVAAERGAEQRDLGDERLAAGRVHAHDDVAAGEERRVFQAARLPGVEPRDARLLDVPT